MSLARYFLNIEDRIPARWINVLERGAIVNGAQASVNTVTVHEGHEIATSDKLYYCPDRTNIQTARVFSVSSAAATSVTFSGGTFSFPDKSLLLNLGADTGAEQQNDGSFSLPNWDAAVITVYKDPAGDDSWTNGRVTVDPGGEFGFWADGRTVWCVVRDSGGIPKRIYMDVAPAGGATASRGSSLPSTGTPGQLFILSQGAGQPDIIYARVKFSDDTYDWLEMIRAT